jgi:hypothetical protein
MRGQEVVHPLRRDIGSGSDLPFRLARLRGICNKRRHQTDAGVAQG